MNTHDHDHDHDHEGHGHTHGQTNVDRALEASREGVRALKISMAALAGTALVQAGVVVASGSVDDGPPWAAIGVILGLAVVGGGVVAARSRRREQYEAEEA